MSKTKNIIVVLFVFILFLVVGWFGFKLFKNNENTQYPSNEELEKSFDLGVFWLNTHRSEILNIESAMLWLMIKESAELSGNDTLKNLYQDYKIRYLNNRPYNAWNHIFLENANPVSLEPIYLTGLNDYNIFFLYAASCNSILGNESIVKDQMSPSFCDEHLISPACNTHQLMSIVEMKRRRCNNPKKVDDMIAILQNRIIHQMFWDFRVVDVYIQRVMMLVDSGAYERVKPVWIKRVLAVQNFDGGWTGLDNLLTINEDISVVFSSTIISIRKNESNFHATAQSVKLMSLLLYKNKDK